jgi:6-phosphogluconolactonase
MSETRTVIVAGDLEALSHQVANQIARTVAEAVAARGRCTLALAGGNTPRRTYELLTEPPLRDAVPWDALHLFWGDERCVPPDHPDSNYRMAREALIDRAPIPAANVHRVRTEEGSAAAVAAYYERELRNFFGLEVEDVPRFDVILLGMGPDGHTVSLFPGSPALDETQRLVVPNSIDYMPHERVTFTFQVLNAARLIAFLITGRDKAESLARALNGDSAVPAGHIRPADGEVRWYLDRAAAGQ